MLAVILLGLATLLVVYLRFVHRYWTRRGVVQDSPLPVFGNILSVILSKQHFGHVLTRIYRENCERHDAIGLYEFFTPKLLVMNTELLKTVLISDFSSFHDNVIDVNEKLDPYFYHDPFCLRGEEWKAARASMAALMTSHKVKEMFPYMKQQIPKLDKYLECNQTKEIEVKELASLFMMDNVSNTMFGLQTNSFTDPEADFRKMGDIFSSDINNRFKIFITKYFPRLRDLLGYNIFSPKINNYLEHMMKKIVEHRKINNIKRNDTIQHIMNKTGDNTFDMVVLGMAIFVDGFETSATLASFALYELALNPEIQEMAYEEIKLTMKNIDDSEYENYLSLTFMDKIVKETMRIHPVLYYQQRRCTKKCILNIDGNPVVIEPNTSVIIPTYAIHNDPRYWPRPDVFDPNRFSEMNSILPCTYIPFGEGPRICPGMKFAGAQVMLFLVNIVYKYKILCTKNTPSKIRYSKTSWLLSPEDPLKLKFEKRC